MSKTKMPSASYDRQDFAALKASSIPSALYKTEGMRFDSADDAALFFARELDHVKAQTYDALYPEFSSPKIFPQSSEVNPGAETYTYYSYEKTGIAKIIDNYSTDLPRADVKGKPTTGYVKSVGASYGYSTQDMRASRMAGKSLDVRKAESARYQIERLSNKIAWAGDEENNVMGILSKSNDIPLYVLPADGTDEASKPSTQWKDKTADQILADITGMMKQVAKVTKNVEKPDTLALPSSVYIDLSTRRIPDTGITVLKFIMDNAPYLKNIYDISEIESDSEETNPYSDTDSAVALLYTNDPKKLTIETPLNFYQYPLQNKGLEVIVPCEQRVAGAVIYYPLSALIALGI